ncbi:substrate-binding domain-containing protein [Dapis sp. BLCC M126]|uniref:substrate-binding domain-containing protein n=1 Tax=Dapis sp. BLCC M126 TaxID=3400189 RepID=UPI003CF51673
MKLKNLLIVFIGILTVATVSSCTGNKDNAPERYGNQQETTNKEMKIGGSSEGYPIMEILANAYENDSIEITFMPSSQSSGGIRGVQDGFINIGVISKELTAVETPENIKYIPIAKNFLVLITNENVKGVSNLSTEQIQGIYNGTISNWKEFGGPDAKIVLLDIPEDETEKQILRENILGENLQVISTAILFQEDDEVLEAVANTPYSIGVIPDSEELKEFSVNTLSLNNVVPNKANIQNGKYKMSQTIGIVFSSEPTSETQEFIDFVLTQEAQGKLELANYIVVDKN